MPPKGQKYNGEQVLRVTKGRSSWISVVRLRLLAFSRRPTLVSAIDLALVRPAS